MTAKKQKPAQPTILKRRTARNLSYLLKHQLTEPFADKSFMVSPNSRIINPFTGETARITDKSPTFGV